MEDWVHTSNLDSAELYMIAGCTQRPWYGKAKNQKMKLQGTWSAGGLGLLDAVTMIGVGIALFFTFANPFVAQV